MKPTGLLLILLIVFSLNSKAQNLSEVDKLACTAKIWGFLKYYHPIVASGKLDWDNELLLILPKLEKVQTKAELSTLFSKWISGLGEVKKCKSCKVKASTIYFDKNFDLSWTQHDDFFSDELSQQLKYIEENRFQGKQYFVIKSKIADNILLQNEKEYPNFDWENKSMRLLSLFRYWNTVEYFFPYKYQMDQNWSDSLKEILPKFLNPKTKQDYHLAMLELVVKLNDSHANLVTSETNNFFGFKWMPAAFKIIDQKAIITRFYNDSLAKLDDIKIGDVITKVDGKSIAQIIADKKQYVPGSNDATVIRNFYYGIFNGHEDKFEMEYIRNGITQNKTVTRYSYKLLQFESPKDKRWKMLPENIGYVNMGEITPKDIDQMFKEFKDTKAIIFDIRNYPKGTLYRIANKLLSKEKEFVKFTYSDLSYPGRFLWTKPLTCGSSNKEHYKGIVVLLVNEETQSHAEFTTMALQTADQAIIIGSQTAGADGNVTEMSFLDASDTYMTGLGVFYPNGRETQRIGIVPNIEIKPTIEGVQNGKDEVLDRALLYIQTGK